MKRLISIIEQDCLIWNLSSEEAEKIFCTGIQEKVLKNKTLKLSEDDLIDAWVQGFRKVVPSLNDDIILYKGVDCVASNYKWMFRNPNSWIKNSL